jgi:AAA domain-containing protein
MIDREYEYERSTQFDLLCLYVREPKLVGHYIEPGYFGTSAIHLDIARVVSQNREKHPEGRLSKSTLRTLVKRELGKRRQDVWPVYKEEIGKIYKAPLNDRETIVDLARDFARERQYRGALVQAEKYVNSRNYDAASREFEKLEAKFRPTPEHKTSESGTTLPVYHIHRFLSRDAKDTEDGDYLVLPIVPKKGAVLIYGLPKEVKSWLGLGLAVDVASGRKALDYFDTPHPAKTLYVQVEDSEALTRQRLRLVVPQRGLGRLVGQLKIVPRCGLNLMDEEWVALLEQEIQKFKPELVVLDVFRRLFRGNVNEAEQTAGFFRVLDTLRDTYGCAIVLIHHARKNNESAAIQTMALGSVNITAWPEVLIYTSNKRKVGSATVAALQLEGKDPLPDGLEIVVDSESDPVVRVQAKAGNEVKLIQAMIKETPGLLQTELQKKARIPEKRLRKILKDGVEQGLWEEKRGEGEGHRFAYFPVSKG